MARDWHLHGPNTTLPEQTDAGLEIPPIDPTPIPEPAPTLAADTPASTDVPPSEIAP